MSTLTQIYEPVKKDLDPLDINLDSVLSELDNDRINYIYLKRQKYQPAWNLQRKLHELVKDNKIPDIVLFLEHDNVYTFGKNADTNYLLNTHPEAEIVQTDRGGEVTYHGPGQLVGYPIINLNHYQKSITWFMRSLEDVIMNSLKHYNISSQRNDGLPGVWVDDEKICAMGVRLSRWVTMHGFALNLTPKMEYYDSMIPCGIQEYGITSIKNLIHKNVSQLDLIKVIVKEFNHVFNKTS